MKRFALCILAAMLVFSGCAATRDDPFRVDTVVRIPVDPTDAPTEAPAELATETPTEESAEEPTELPTEPEETAAKKASTSSKGSSSGKSSSSASSQNQPASKKEPAATQPPETVPVETIPAAEPPTEAPYDPSSYGVGGLEYAIADEINAYRAKAELPELSLSGRLSGIAFVRAQEISLSWSHTRPDGRGYTSALGDYGYGYSVVSENLVYVSGDGDASTIVAKWMGSDSNSADLLSSDFTKAGIGVYRAGGMTYVACLLVG